MISLTQVLMSMIFTVFTLVPPYRWYSPIPFIVVYMTFTIQMSFVSKFMPDHLNAAAAIVPGIQLGMMWVLVGVFCFAAEWIKSKKSNKMDFISGFLSLSMGIIVLIGVIFSSLVVMVIGPYITV